MTKSRLTLIRHNVAKRGKQTISEYLCSCGTKKLLLTGSVNCGNTKSCGCLRKETSRKKFSTHGAGLYGKRERLYNIWNGMKDRCNNPNSTSFHIYGAKGIKICDEWTAYTTFKEWAINNGYENHLTIDRINNDLGYYPGNCKWSTKSEQGKNTSRVVPIEIKDAIRKDGESMSYVDLMAKYGVSVATITRSKMSRR